jgi:hypothetical protein
MVNNQLLSLNVRILFVFIIASIFFTPSVFGQRDDRKPARPAEGGEVTPRKGKGSKIIDDSTKNIYGPTTSQYYYEDEFFQNRKATHFIDTSAWNFHQFNYVQRYNNLYQDLGNIGTAIRPIFNQVSETIGANTGFDSYDLYWNSETIRHYDTKSPYSNMKVILGGKGRSVTRVTFSRNITPRWNFGFNYRSLLIDKQIQRSGKGDRNVRSTYFDLNTVFHSKDSVYSVFINYRRNFQQADEYGGVLTEDGFSYQDFFMQNAQRSLFDAESSDRRDNIHLYQQLRLGSGLQLYHKSDLYKQLNKFRDSASDSAYFDYVVIDSLNARDQVQFNTFRNEVGVKGNLLKLFYNGYAAVRNYSMDYKYFYENNFYLDTDDDELYVGGRIALQVDSLIEVKGWTEWMLDDRYVVQGSITTKWFAASAKRSVSTPTFLQQAYRGSHDLWMNYFNNVEATEVKGNLIYESKIVGIYPGVRFSTFKNYVFFKEDSSSTGQKVFPIQSRGYQTWVSPELNFRLTLAKRINVNTQAIYTRILENSEDAIQVPEMFINTQLSYSNIWFKGNLDFQFGADVHWKSAYYAPAYDPAIQQFYNQQSFVSPSFPVVDIFLNAKIKRARIFVKYNNLFKMFNDYGNIPTPYYPGIKSIIDFGFDWSFYD